MMSQLLKTKILTICVLFLMSGSLVAHQKKEAITRVIFNERTASIEIIHRFSIHDAEHAAKQLFGKSSDLIDDEASQKQFADYVTQQFNMSSLNAKSLPLTMVGFEVDGRFIWIYQETSLTTSIAAKLKGLSIINNALREVWTEQVNLLNIERSKKIHTLVFRGSLDAQQATF